MNILITGGAGYIGSHVLNLFSDENSEHKIFTYDNLSTGHRSSVLTGEFIQADLEDITTLENVIIQNNINAVFHFAGSTDVEDSINDPVSYYKNNTLNTLNLVELCLKHNVNRFIFSSTAAVYGSPTSGVGKEGDPTTPISPYGATKLMAEQILNDVGSANPEFRFIILRYFNVAGAAVKGNIGPKTVGAKHLIKAACETALGKRNQIEIFGDDYNTPDGTCIRDFIHVDDLAQAHIDALNYLEAGANSDTFNVGYGRGYSVREVLETTKKISGSKFIAKVSTRRKGDIPSLISDPSQIKKKVGWVPKNNDLNLIIKTAIKWEEEEGLQH